MNVSRRKTATILPFRMFLKQKNISLNSIQSAKFDEFKIFRKILQKPAQNWENCKSVLSASEISLDAPIRIESESKYVILIG